jgi:hypothetical protein
LVIDDLIFEGRRGKIALLACTYLCTTKEED